MKKILLFILTLGITGVMNAQTEQGNFFLGASSNANLLFSSLKLKSDAEGFKEGDAYKYSQINFSPVGGYFVMDNLAVGAIFDYNYEKEEDSDAGSTLAIGPMARYYFNAGSVLPYVQALAVFGGTGNDDVSQTALGGGVGVGIPISDAFTFDILADYRSITTKRKNENPNNNRYVTGQLGFRFGFTLILE